MKMKRFHEFLVRSVGLLLVLTICSAGASTQFRLSDGDDVVCTPIQQQPSLQPNKHWNKQPSTKVTPGHSTSDAHGVKVAKQTLMAETEGCPVGTYPLRVDHSSTSPRKQRRGGFGLAGGRRLRQVAGPPHEYAIGSIDTTKTPTTAYKGTEVFLNMWKPFVETSGEFSLAQLWLACSETASNGEPLNTIEVGYQVDFGFYGDSLPRLFVYWTGDGYVSTGCYDLDCSGFVQVSNKVLLAGSFTPISTVSGQQYEIQLRVFKDDEGTGDWWLQLNGENVGYWPQALYSSLKQSAASVQWGGEIVDDFSNDGNLHTKTQMGSGQPANLGFGQAAFQRSLQYINQAHTLVDAPFTLFTSNQSCYSAETGTQILNWGSYFYYGGKGYNSLCTAHP